MEKMAKELDSRANELDDMSSRTDIALQEMRLQFETMMEMQRQERADMAKLNEEEKDKMRKNYGRIIFGLILTLFLLIGGIIGSAVYILTNFDFAVADFTQAIDIGGDGNPIIYDGIHHNAD